MNKKEHTHTQKNGTEQNYALGLDNMVVQGNMLPIVTSKRKKKKKKKHTKPNLVTKATKSPKKQGAFYSQDKGCCSHFRNTDKLSNNKICTEQMLGFYM